MIRASFESLGLDTEFLRALDELGYVEPTPIQQQAIPLALDGRDVVGSAQTGTGKTAAFLLPILQRFKHGGASLRALVLVPTRELAEQVLQAAHAYGRYCDATATAVYGGVALGPQASALTNGVDIVIATPGRLIDHMNRGNVDMSGIEVLVLDEADRMLDMGFARDVNRILDALPAKRQTLLFSATINTDVDRLARRAMDNHAAVEVSKRAEAAEGVEHFLVAVDRSEKRPVLAKLLKELPTQGRTLVFTRTKHGAERLTRQLRADGNRVASLHGGKTQSSRNEALDRFRNGRIRILIATDVAARGIDVDNIVMVVNYDVPPDPEVYVHRVGRTARAGARGVALTLMSMHEWLPMGDIERHIGQALPREIVPGFEPDVLPVQPGERRMTSPRVASIRLRSGAARRR